MTVEVAAYKSCMLLIKHAMEYVSIFYLPGNIIVRCLRHKRTFLMCSMYVHYIIQKH
jgi:hypothetical protein